MADLYKTITGLQPNQQDIIEAELLARQILEAQFPDLDLREGTGLRDLVLRPSAYILALCKKGNDSYFAQNTLKGADDNTPQEVIDGLLSNWFLDRNQGTFAVINVRLYFARQKNVTLALGTSFSPDGALLYYPLQTQVFVSNALQFDAGSNEWFIDVDLQASDTGSAYNLSSGSLLYFSTFDPFFLHAEINYLVSESRNAETNTEFITRSKTAINTRNLINQASIVGTLQQTFNYLPRMTVVGARDPDMMRDQAKLVFEPEVPRPATSLSYSGTTVTVGLPNHGFYTGQYVVISSAIPSGYNSTFPIIVVDNSTFTYSLGSNPGTCVSLPSVQSTTPPTYAHLGGYVDVYCGGTVEKGLIQVTLDNTGYAQITGPVYHVERSPISGGASPDTMPASYPITITSVAYVPSSNSVTVTALDHGYIGTFPVLVSGISQTRAVTAISCNSKLVTVTCPLHGMATGDFAQISGVFPVEYNGVFSITVINSGVFTYVSNVDIFSAGNGSSMLATNPYLAGLFTATYLTVDSFSVSIPNFWGSTSPSGVFAAGYVPQFYLLNPNLQSGNATFLTATGNEATATITGHGLVRNRFVTVSGCSVSAYNGTWRIDEVIDANTVTFTIDSVSPSVAYAAVVTYCAPEKDVGFSNRQVMGIQFPISQAGKTVSLALSKFKNIPSVQDYLDLSSTRVLCADYLARGFNVYVLDIDLVVYNSLPPSTGAAAIALSAYLDAMPPGAPLVLSDVVKNLAASGIQSLQTPVGVRYSFYHRDLVPTQTGTVVDYLDPRDSTSIFVLGVVTCSSASV